MSFKVEPISCPLELGKSLRWDECSKLLYFVDKPKGTVHSYNPDTNLSKQATVGDCPKQVAIVNHVAGKKNKLMVSLNNEIATVCWNGTDSKTSTPKIIASLEPNCPKIINTGRVDPSGGLWAGTAGEQICPDSLVFEEDVGAVYSLKDCGKVTKQFDKVTMPTGLGWTEDKFYFTDALKYNITVSSYDSSSNRVCNPQEIFNTKKNCIDGYLAGFCMDTDGKLYIANYLGSQVIVFDPKCCKVCQKIPIPAEEVTDCTFGGPNLDILYVSSGNTQPGNSAPLGGRVFSVTCLGAKGNGDPGAVL